MLLRRSIFRRARQNISVRYFEIIAKLQITGNKGAIWRKRSRGNLTCPNFLPPLNVVYGAISAYFRIFFLVYAAAKRNPEFCGVSTSANVHECRFATEIIL